MTTIGAKFWNLGVTVGVIGILAGDSTGYETLEMPFYAALLLFIGYSTIGVYGLLTLHRRRYFSLFVSQWFLVAALFWFPWIYSTAYMLISVFPVRGITQAAIAYWYAANLQTVWMGAVGLAAAFYLVPKLKQRELHSHNLALFTFWGLVLFGGWTGIPHSAPLPAWMAALSSSASVLMLIPLLTVRMNLYRTIGCVWTRRESHESLRFVCVGIAGFLAAGLVSILVSFPLVARVTELTWFAVARQHLTLYGFFAFMMFGAIYYIVPRLTGIEFCSAKLIRAHLVLAIAGVSLIAIPLAIGGILQGVRLGRPGTGFNEITKGTLMFLRASTVGDLCLAIGHVVLLLNLAGMVRRFCQTRVNAVYSSMTEEIKPAGAGA
jgi:cytochrome c oxidase cbb3-type subunit 1